MHIKNIAKQTTIASTKNSLNSKASNFQLTKPKALGKSSSMASLKKTSVEVLNDQPTTTKDFKIRKLNKSNSYAQLSAISYQSKSTTAFKPKKKNVIKAIKLLMQNVSCLTDNILQELFVEALEMMVNHQIMFKQDFFKKRTIKFYQLMNLNTVFISISLLNNVDEAEIIDKR